MGMDRVQEFLGHTRPAMTKRYAKMNVEGLRPVLRKEHAGDGMGIEVLNNTKNGSP